MKKIIAALLVVGLIFAFSTLAEARQPGGRPAPSFHGGHGAYRHPGPAPYYRPAPPPARYYRPVPPPYYRPAYPVYYPNYYGGYYGGSGFYYSSPRVGVSIGF